MKKYQKEIIGIYFFFISIFIALSLFGYDIITSSDLMGPIGAIIAKYLLFYIGIGSYFLPIILVLSVG